MHVLCAGEQPWRLFEGPVGRERHPVRSKVIGNIDAGGARALVQHGGLFKFQGVGLACKLSASSLDGNPRGLIFPANPTVQGLRFTFAFTSSIAPIQNTSASECSVSSHNNGSRGNAASSAAPPRPIS